MTVLVDDRCGGGLFLRIMAVIVAVDYCRSDDRRSDLCRIDANLTMVVAIDDCCSNGRCGCCRGNDCHE